ncbi:MAG TPA: glutaminyl-peptide cyclotransferase [Bryobacteraceae bacterium]|nr:glutaminyl-peptide cyclotransferase [Bryobacteraceae bacterium]
MSLLLGLLSPIAAVLLLAGAHSPPQTPLEYTFQVVHIYPHDRAAFTEGLEYHDGFLYESTGMKGRSWIRKTRVETGAVAHQIDLAPQFFGEGITLVNNRIVQLTYESGVGFVYDARDFHVLRRFSYRGEGWGLTSNGREIFMSDGTPEIRVLDPATLAEKRRIRVHDRGNPVRLINELEYVDGEIFANVWHTDRIARIAPETGEVRGWIDLSGLLSPMYRLEGEAVLNGIAWDAVRHRLFVTGKFWPNVFEIEVKPKNVR